MNSTERDGRYSARPAVLLGLAGVLILVGGLIVWGLIASIDSAVIASGRLSVEARNRPIEHARGGVVDSVFVRDGDQVATGDPLVRFAYGGAQAELSTLELREAELRARRSRLEAEWRGSSSVPWDSSLLDLAAASPPVAVAIAAEEIAFATRTGLSAQLAAVYEERIALAHSESEVAELEAELLQRESQRLSEIEALLSAARTEQQQTERRIQSIRDQLAVQNVRAPISGTVFGMTVAGPGDVIRPAEPLLYIVPDGSPLVVSARVEPIHVDRVHVGQEATILFSAFPYRSSPERSGRVMSVSADAIVDNQTGLSWFTVELAIDEPSPDDVYEIELALVPGMPAEVFINTGDRPVISYLLKPITDFFSRSLREE